MADYGKRHLLLEDGAFCVAAELSFSEVICDVARHNELRALGAEIIGAQLVGMFEAQLGTEEDGRADPVAVADEMFRVCCGVAGALAFDVVDKFVAN